MSSSLPKNGDTYVAPALAANKAWFGLKINVRFVLIPSEDNTFVAFQHDDSGKGDNDEADCENIRKVSPPLSGVVVQACHCSDERAAGDRFVDCLSRTNVYLQVGPAFQEHFHDVRFREIVLGIVTCLLYTSPSPRDCS